MSPLKFASLRHAAENPGHTGMSLIYAPDLLKLLAERTEMEALLRKANDICSSDGHGPNATQHCETCEWLGEIEQLLPPLPEAPR